MLADIRDRRIRRQILTRLHALQQHPKSIEVTAATVGGDLLVPGVELHEVLLARLA